MLVQSTSPISRRLAALAVAALLAAIALLCAAPHARADTTYHVETLEDRGGQEGICITGHGCSLREALELTRWTLGASGHVTIEIEAEGTMLLDGHELEAATQPQVESISIVGPGEGKLQIDAHESSRAFLVEGDVSFSGLAIENGSAPSEPGGGIYVKSGDVSLDHVLLVANQAKGAAEGGGIAMKEGSLTIERSRLEENTAVEEGGGIYVEGGPLTISDTSFTRNHSEASGGAIALHDDKLEVTESSFTENSAEDGGAIWTHDDSEAFLADSELTGNKAGEDGGAIYSTGRDLLVEATEFTGNEAGDSGSAVFSIGPATIEDSTAAANKVPEEGSGDDGPGGTIATEGNSASLVLDSDTIAGNTGVGVFGDHVTVRASTIVDNEAVMAGAGIMGEDQTVVSSVLYGNISGGAENDCGGEIAVAENNYIGPNQCTGPEGAIPASTASPELSTLRDNGGPTKTMAPVGRDSPLINAGAEPKAVDQRGKPRPIPDSPADADIGAVEVQAPVVGAGPTLDQTGEVANGSTLTCTKIAEVDLDTIEDAGEELTWKVGEEAVAGEGSENESLFVRNEYAGKPITCVETIEGGVVAPIVRTSAAAELTLANPTATPTSVDFGRVPVGASSGEPVEVTLTDTGGASFEVTKVEFDLGESFKLFSNECSTPRQLPESTCAVLLYFEPKAAGEESGQVKFETTVGDVTVELAGTGTEAKLSVSPEELDFGEAEVGGTSAGPFAVTATNVGNETMDVEGVEIDEPAFQVADGQFCDVELKPGEHCELTLKFAPDAAGRVEGQLTFRGSGAGVALSGTGTAPGFTAEPASFDFGRVPHGTTSHSKHFAITNSGTAPLHVGEVGLGGTNATSFAIPVDNCSNRTVAVGDECAVEVTFSPAAAGDYVAQLEFPTDIEAAAQTVALQGKGGSAQFAADPEELDLAAEVGSTSGPQTVTVANAGDESMSIGQPTLEGAGAGAFAIAAGGTCEGASLGAHEECTAAVTFTPTGPGTVAATLAFPGTEPGSVDLIGEGREVHFVAAPSGQQFPAVTLGESDGGGEVTILNDGNAPGSLGTVEVTGSAADSFTVGGSCAGSTLGVNESCAVPITFTPKALGLLTATIRFNGGVEIPVEGTGVAGAIEFIPGAVDFGDQDVENAPEPREIEVRNGGEASAKISAIELAGADASEFQLRTGGNCAAGMTLGRGASCEVELAFSPFDMGEASAELVVTTGAGRFVAALSGDGKIPWAEIKTTPGGNEGSQAAAVESPAPAPAPTPTAEVRAPRGPLTVGGSGSVGVTLSCAAPSGSTCPLKLALVPAGKGGKLPKRLGSWFGRVAGGSTRTVKVPLGKSAREALAEAGRLRAVLVLSWEGGEERIPVMIRAPRRTKH